MSNEALALGITLGIHIVGIFVLVGLLIRSDDGGGPAPGPPLPSADPSQVRLREPGRLADAHPRPPRRPEHAPERVPQRERV